MTWETFRPRGRFEEQKVYWDGKNNIYGLKKEVGVMAAEPHYALLSSKGHVANTHDYQIHKETYRSYVPYLEKLTEERAMLPMDQQSTHWAIIADKAYIGPEGDTPNVRRLTPKKATGGRRLTNDEQSRNRELKLLRVYVECFFGRLQKLWKVARETYRWDHSAFDTDSDNMILLTNEHIKAYSLEEEDKQFHKQVLAEKKTNWERKKEKRVRSQQTYLQRKRRRLSGGRFVAVRTASAAAASDDSAI